MESRNAENVSAEPEMQNHKAIPDHATCILSVAQFGRACKWMSMDTDYGRIAKIKDR